jgi:hypothetical protein
LKKKYYTILFCFVLCNGDGTAPCLTSNGSKFFEKITGTEGFLIQKDQSEDQTGGSIQKQQN